MDYSKKSNKIRDVVRLQQLLKKWKSFAKNKTQARIESTKSIKFLKKTLSFSDNVYSSLASNDVVPKGFLAVCVGEELKRYVIPMAYLSHVAFGALLREAEDEFGFQQEGVLKIPCHVSVFDKILKAVDDEKPEDLDLLVGGRCSNYESESFQSVHVPNSNVQMIIHLNHSFVLS